MPLTVSFIRTWLYVLRTLTTADLITACIGIPLLLEATRHLVGPPLAIIALLFNLLTRCRSLYAGYLRRRQRLLRWLITNGSPPKVYSGLPWVSPTSFVFLFVLFGALLERAGAGNYFIQLAFSLLGHMRGGPAKAAVVASGLTGMISRFIHC